MCLSRLRKLSIGEPTIHQTPVVVGIGAAEVPKRYQQSQGRPSSVRFGYGSCMGRFGQFQFWVPTFPLRKGFSCFNTVLTERDGSGSSFGSSISGKKQSTRINFLGPETARSGRVLPREGVAAEKLVPSLEGLSAVGVEERNLGCPGNLPGCLGPLGLFKKFVQKKFVRIFRSLQ